MRGFTQDQGLLADMQLFAFKILQQRSSKCKEAGS